MSTEFDNNVPKVFVLRQPSPDSAELIITTVNRKTFAFPLTRGQVTLLNQQSGTALKGWPRE